MKSKSVKVYTTSIIDDHYYNKDDMKGAWTDIELLNVHQAILAHPDANCLFLSWGSGVLYRFKFIQGK